MTRYLDDWPLSSSRFAQFYTNPSMAGACWRVLHDSALIAPDAFYVEPSAGAGAFYDLMPSARRFGCDIDPHPFCPVLQADFLELPLERLSFPGQVVVVGNPPFGHSRVHSVRTPTGLLGIASAFFNRCALFADVIAFVLPAGYSTRSPRSWSFEFVPGFDLVSEHRLPASSFWGPDASLADPDGGFSYPCVFQVWRRIPLLSCS